MCNKAIKGTVEGDIHVFFFFYQQEIYMCVCVCEKKMEEIIRRGLMLNNKYP